MLILLKCKKIPFTWLNRHVHRHFSFDVKVLINRTWRLVSSWQYLEWRIAQAYRETFWCSSSRPGHRGKGSQSCPWFRTVWCVELCRVRSERSIATFSIRMWVHKSCCWDGGSKLQRVAWSHVATQFPRYVASLSRTSLSPCAPRDRWAAAPIRFASSRVVYCYIKRKCIKIAILSSSLRCSRWMQPHEKSARSMKTYGTSPLPHLLKFGFSLPQWLFSPCHLSAHLPDTQLFLTSLSGNSGERGWTMIFTLQT